MPRGKVLSVEERATIRAYKENCWSNRAIAKKLGRSVCAINNYMKLKEKYNTKKRTGRKPTISKRQKRLIRQKAINERMNASQVRADLDLPVTVRHVRRILSGSDNLIWTKRKPKPQLKERHKNARLLFAETYMSYKDEWKNILFSDEKKFNLDGPDGFQHYWHDLRRDKELRLSRNFGGGSVMVWGCFCYHGKLPLATIPTRMNSKMYIELLEDLLIDNAESIVGPDFVFQQDNAAVHVSREAKAWFNSKNITVLEWPACSPDLNPIENLWGIISRKVYENGRQFSNTRELREKIIKVWEEIPVTTLQTLVNSMQKRVFQVIKSKGSHTKY